MAATGSYKQQCPSCEAMVLIKDPKMVGKKIDCPQCKYRFVVEKPAGRDDEEANESAPVTKGKGEQAVTAKKPAPGPAAPQLKKKAAARKPVEDEDEAPVAEKEASSSRVMMMMIGLSVLAVALLGVGGYFLFFKGDDTPPNTGPVGVRPPPSMKTGPAKVAAKGELEVTNLLPNDTQVVLNLSFKDLVNSSVGRAAFESPGAFSHEGMQKALGLKMAEVERLVIALNVKKPWTFAVVSTTKPIDFTVLSNALALEKQNAIKGQDYFKLPPSDWVHILERQVTEALPGGKPAEKRSLFVRQVDTHTLVFADEAVMKDFLEVEGRPPVKEEAAGGQPAKKEEAGHRYLTIDPALRRMLDRVETKPPLISLAWDMAIFPVEAWQKRLKEDAVRKGMANLGIEADKMAERLGEVRSGALAVQFKNNLELQFVALNKNTEGPKFWQNLVTDFLRKEFVNEALGKNHVALTLGGNINLGDQKTPSGKITLDGLEKGPVWMVDVTLTSMNKPIAQEVEDALRPLFILFRAAGEMAGEKAIEKHRAELAQALKDYVAKTGQFPRGTVDRKLPQGRTRPYDPIDRVSWMAELLPFLGDYAQVSAPLDLNRSWKEDRNVEMGGVPIPAFLAGREQHSWWKMAWTPTGEHRYATTHFVGMAGVGMNAAEYDSTDPRAGVFGYDRVTKPADITDGLASTIAIIQVPPTFRRPWIAGGGATVMGVPDKNSIKPFVCAEHEGKKGTFAIMADGSIRFIPATIADAVFKALCTIHAADAVNLAKDTVLIQAAGQAVLKAKDPGDKK